MLELVCSEERSHCSLKQKPSRTFSVRPRCLWSVPSACSPQPVLGALADVKWAGSFRSRDPVSFGPKQTSLSDSPPGCLALPPLGFLAPSASTFQHRTLDANRKSPGTEGPEPRMEMMGAVGVEAVSLYSRWPRSVMQRTTTGRRDGLVWQESSTPRWRHGTWDLADQGHHGNHHFAIGILSIAGLRASRFRMSFMGCVCHCYSGVS